MNPHLVHTTQEKVELVQCGTWLRVTFRKMRVLALSLEDRMLSHVYQAGGRLLCVCLCATACVRLQNGNCNHGLERKRERKKLLVLREAEMSFTLKAAVSVAHRKNLAKASARSLAAGGIRQKESGQCNERAVSRAKFAPSGMRQKGKKKNFINAKFSARASTNTRNGSKVLLSGHHKGTNLPCGIIPS